MGGASIQPQAVGCGEDYSFQGGSPPTTALQEERDVAFEAFQAGIVGGAWPSADFLSSPGPELEVEMASASAFLPFASTAPQPRAESAYAALPELEAPTVLQQRPAPPVPSGKPRHPSLASPSSRSESTAAQQAKGPVIGEWLAPATS